MTQVRPEIAKIASVSALLFLLLYSGVLLYFGADRETLLGSAAKSGALLTLIVGFWAFYNKWGWRLRPLRLGGWLSAVPDLNGRWEGTVCRHRDDSPHPFVMEITQTFSKLSFRTFSATSRGESIVAALFVDDTGPVFSVVAVWRTTTRRHEDRTVEDTFDGASLWRVSFVGDTKRIEDQYFTRREPATKGVADLTWISSTLTNRFES